MIPNLLPVVFRGRFAALAGDNRFYLAPHVEVLEGDHPDRVFVSVMCFHARDVPVGRAHGPYRDDFAEQVARSSLMADREFGRVANLGNADLAELFSVPLEQVAAKRSDLVRPERVRT
ncbi:MAG: hypothetical protein WKF94_02360 [Solirubrobacteraceae bacterium]